MRRGLPIPFVVIGAVVAILITFLIARGISGGDNIAKRQKYWAKEISEGLKAGAPKEDLQAFTTARGQTLRCHQNYKREDVCDFFDNQSLGGTRNIPVKLVVTFVMKDNKVSSHRFEAGSATMAN